MAHRVYKVLEECFETQAAALRNDHMREPVMYTRCFLEGTAETIVDSPGLGAQVLSLDVSKIYALPHGVTNPIECESGVDPETKREFATGATISDPNCRIRVRRTWGEVANAEKDLAAHNSHSPLTIFLGDTSMVCRLITGKRVPSYKR
jgi:hypothetical protein